MRILFFQDEKKLPGQLCLSHPFGTFFVNGLKQKLPFCDKQQYILMPESWLRKNPQLKKSTPLSYQGQSWLVPGSFCHSVPDEIYVLNGRSFFTIDEKQLNEALRSCSWQIAFVEVCSDLQGDKERFKLAPHNRVVGFRRIHTSLVEPSDIPGDWPQIVIFKRDAFREICINGGFPTDFKKLIQEISRLEISAISLRIGGRRTSFDTKAGILKSLEVFQDVLMDGKESAMRPEKCKIIEPVFIGNDVTVESDVTMIGPVVLSDRVHIKSNSVVRRSILAEDIMIENGRFVNNQVCQDQTEAKSLPTEASPSICTNGFFSSQNKYRKWPFFSYARLGKRIFDIIASLIILILLAPVFPIIVLMIKLESGGPIFYRARRQGLGGREFDCLKFRTMMVQADAMQERLRVVNQVDGPQFKIVNDPRISGAGKFLRDTCIDELPQFVNVLLGQMSIVGPRPSPENENDSCPAWRDARLSVRPGITGLWQVLRTRRSGADFQEWVYYDTEYVRNLSFRKDIWICWKTATMLIHTFLEQFG